MSLVKTNVNDKALFQSNIISKCIFNPKMTFIYELYVGTLNLSHIIITIMGKLVSKPIFQTSGDE